MNGLFELTYLDIFLVLLLSTALYWDLRYNKIPNKITITVMFFGLLYHFITGGFDGFVGALLGGVLGIGILFIPFVFGGIGGGDVKLLGALGILAGAEFVFYTALCMGVIGGIISLYFYLTKKNLKATFPYGICIALGAVITMSVF